MNQERNNEQPQHPAEGHSSAPAPPRVSARKTLIAIVVLLVTAVVIGIAGVVPRIRARAQLKDQTDRLAAPDVMIAPPTVGKAESEIVLPGNIYAFTDSPIYARTDGYLEKWYFDIGARVRKGELLATISSPEVDQQLLQARADLATAQANAGLAKTNAQRYKGLVDQNAVSQQDTDTFVSQAASTSSTVKSALANVQRLEELQSFEKIYAPFDGVVTARNVDIGQLINAGAAQQMFHMAAIDVLRVYVNVPQVYSRGAVPGLPAQLTFAEFPGESFPGKLVRTTKSIDPNSRTLLVEVDVNNRNGRLVPGAYAQVHMNVNAKIPSFIIPVSALIFRSEGLQVATVVKGPNGDQAKLVKVTLGHDDGMTVQVLSGLDNNSQVIQNPPDSIIDGEPVHVVQPHSGRDGEPQSPSSGSRPE
jgi:RND family efflux transporter MFP subunit